MKVKSIKKIGNKYKIILDNEEVITTNDQVIINNNLLYDKKLSKKELEKIKEDTNYYENYNKILKMINRKIRCEFEIRKKLNKLSKVDQDKMIDHLKEVGLIDDSLFAESYVKDKINLTLEGPDKIRKELEAYNIDNDYIERSLESFSQDLIDSKLEKIINKKIKSSTKDTTYIFKQKTSLYLLNLGYSREDVINHLEGVKLNNDLGKEMFKIYNKLKAKYEGYTLCVKLKQKLYSKGFTSDEINDFIEKTVH